MIVIKFNRSEWMENIGEFLLLTTQLMLTLIKHHEKFCKYEKLKTKY